MSFCTIGTITLYLSTYTICNIKEHRFLSAPNSYAIDNSSLFTVEYVDSIKSNCFIRSKEDFSKEDIGLGRKWKSKIKTLYPFVNFIVRKKNNKGILFISQTNNYLLSVYKSHGGIWCKIQYLIKCGILVDLKSRSDRKTAKYYYASDENINTYLRAVFEVEVTFGSW